jgi:8-oxo-dGTP diphosphatase
MQLPRVLQFVLQWKCCAKGAMTRTNYRVTGVVIREGKLLLIHRLRDGNEYWVFPGGGVEEGEGFESALKREMMEETGLNPVSYQRLFDQLEKDRSCCIFYSCVLEPGEPCLGGPELEEQSPNNQHRLVWVNLEQLSSLVTVYPRPAKLLDYLQNSR